MEKLKEIIAELKAYDWRGHFDAFNWFWDIIGIE